MDQLNPTAAEKKEAVRLAGAGEPLPGTNTGFCCFRTKGIWS